MEREPTISGQPSNHVCRCAKHAPHRIWRLVTTSVSCVRFLRRFPYVSFTSSGVPLTRCPSNNLITTGSRYLPCLQTASSWLLFGWHRIQTELNLPCLWIVSSLHDQYCNQMRSSAWQANRNLLSASTAQDTLCPMIRVDSPSLAAYQSLRKKKKTCQTSERIFNNGTAATFYTLTGLC